MRRLLLAGFAFSIGSVTAANCPAFTEVKSIPKITKTDRIYEFDGGYVAVVNNIRLDLDGSPLAYHPENKGTEELCNGLDPFIDGKCDGNKKKTGPCYAAVNAAIREKWDRERSPSFCRVGFYIPGAKVPNVDKLVWGGGKGTGPIPLQGPNDPAPGFFISTTTLPNPGVKDDKLQAKYVDADRVPYAVVPGSLVTHHALPKGGIVWAWSKPTDHTASGIVGDTQASFGEISVAFAQLLEKGALNPITRGALAGTGPIPWPYSKKASGAIRATDEPKGPVVFIYFAKPPAHALTQYSVDTIRAAANGVLASHGGAEQLKSCVSDLVK